ncbi:MAG TPA: CPBP family intramembrane glutamic endopeptidase [Caulobacteraceae bacterium]|nr:CPBP family intramembrane glutamic endopeptidase [Caulobacteraceae bacterium]
MSQAGSGLWNRFPVSARAIVSGLLVGLTGANVWSLFLIGLGPQVSAVVCETLFLIIYLAWTRGMGPPAWTQSARRSAARVGRLSVAQWTWGLIAAIAFPISVHAALIVLFRLTPFPAAAFHQGYDLSAAPDRFAQWLVVIIAAASAGICEETGFRGYLQRPIEDRHGPGLAILISAVLFTLFHMNKTWMVSGMTPLVFGAGLLLGLIAWSSRSLIFSIIGHTLMDIGLFAYWWSQVAGVFSARTIFQAGVDSPFLIACAVLLVAVAATLTAVWRLARGGSN